MRVTRWKRSVAAIGVVAGTIISSPAWAKQWKTTLSRVVVAATKSNGQPWDGDNSPPDVLGEFGAGMKQGGRCPITNLEKIPKHQDAYDFSPDISIVSESDKAEDLCFRIRLVDRDLVDDDPIGDTAAILEPGQHQYKVGQAEIEVLVESLGGEGTVRQAAVELPPPPSSRPTVYKVSVVTARIHSAKADGATWDEPTDKDAEDAKLMKGLLGIGLAVATAGSSAIVQASASALKAGSEQAPQVTYKAQTASAPDPRVVIKWGDVVLDTPKAKNTFSPRWTFEFIVSADVAERKPLRIDVFDGDDGDDDPIGSDSVSGSEVVKTDVFRHKFGGVEELVLEIEKLREGPMPFEKKVKIETTRGWVDTGIDVIAGQTLQITATGQHCLPGGRCVGPEGGEGIAFQEDASSAPVHEGELAAVIGDTLTPVGAAGNVLAKASGRLVLGVASKASSGSLAATVRVFFPLVP